jgi:hypothetical protein
METSPHQTWTSETSRRWPWAKAPNPKYAPKEIQNSGVELTHIASYVMVIALMACCMLLSTWSRIDLRETAVALDRSERAYATAQAEATRLRLELATLEDPAWLSQAVDTLSLDQTVPVVDVQPTTNSD